MAYPLCVANRWRTLLVLCPHNGFPFALTHLVLALHVVYVTAQDASLARPNPVLAPAVQPPTNDWFSVPFSSISESFRCMVSAIVSLMIFDYSFSLSRVGEDLWALSNASSC